MRLTGRSLVAAVAPACYIPRMNIAFRSAMTVQEYLDWATTNGELKRTELINGQIVLLPPECVAHCTVKIAVLLALKQALAIADVSGEAFTNGLTVPIDEHTAYEPDALVRCGSPLPRDQITVTDPIIVVEVKSPTTAHMDTSAKLVGYFKLASVRHYLFVDPDARSVTHHARGADGTISARVLTAGTIRLDPPGIAV
jgi:Uma2 family endonuclease